MAFVVMVYIVMAPDLAVMAYTVMAFVVMAYIVMALDLAVGRDVNMEGEAADNRSLHAGPGCGHN